MVRRLGRGLGGSLRRSGRFRPLGSGEWRALDQCSGALGDRESSQVVCSTSRRCLSGSLRRQFDCRVISEEPRRDSLFTSELHRSEDSPLGGGSVDSDFPAVCYGETQCVGGRSFSPEPDLGLRVDAEAGGLHGSVQEVAGVNRPVCNITKSLMFTLFFSLPRSQFSGDGCTAPKLEWVAGVCLSSLVSHSSSVEEALVVLWGATDHRSSVLASEAVVSGSFGSGGRRPSRSATVQRPSASASLPPFPSRGVQAVSSSLETIKRFTCAGGFSRRVAQQVSLARRPSSRAGYQSNKWLIFRQWCRSEGYSISCPALPKIADFLFYLRRSRRLSVSAIMGYRSILSTVFKSVLPEISTSPVIHDLLRSFQAEAPIREVRPPSWDLNVVLTFLRSSSFEPLTTISLRDLTRKTLFLPQRGLVRFRRCRVGFLSLLLPLVCLMCRSLWPRPNRPCGLSLDPLLFHILGILLQVCLRIYFCVRYVRFQHIETVHQVQLIDLAVCLCLLDVPPGRCPKTGFLLCYVKLLFNQVLAPEADGFLEHIALEALLRHLPFSVIGLFGAFWRRCRGGRTRFLRHFICGIYPSLLMEFILWVHLLLLVSALGNSHLFLTCSGGGGVVMLVRFPHQLV